MSPEIDHHPHSGYLHRYDPFRKPDWRWRRAQFLLDKKKRPDRHDDDQVRLLLQYQKRVAKRGITEAVRHRWPDLAGAHSVHERSGALVDEIQARLLAGEDVDRIATMTGVPASVLVKYEAAFFDVHDSLNACDWLVSNVLEFHEWDPAELTLGQIWKWIALAAGPYLLNIVIADDLGRDEPHIEDRTKIADRARFLVKEAATSMSPEASLTIMTEALEWVGEDRDAESIFKQDPNLMLHMRIIRWAAESQAQARARRTIIPEVGEERGERGPNQSERNHRRTNMPPH